MPHLMKSTTTTVCLLLTALLVHSQDAPLKILDHSDFLIWNKIQDQQISADGSFTIYRMVPGEGDPRLAIYDAVTKSTSIINRVSKAGIDYSGKYIYGVITPPRDTLRNLERRKVDKKEWPCDTLLVMQGPSGNIVRIPFVVDYKVPARQGDWLAYTVKEAAMPADTSKEKKKSKKEIQHLIVRQLSTGQQDTLRHVIDYTWAEKAGVLLAITESSDSTEMAGVAYWSNFQWTYIKKQKGSYAKLSLPPDGNLIAFLGNVDTTKAQVEPWELFYYDFKSDSAKTIASKNKTALPLVSKDADLRWSEDGKYLYYGRAEMPFIQDTTLLPDEIVDVEIWSTQDPRIYTQQNVERSKDEKKSYAYVYDTGSKQHIAICSPTWESAVYGPERTGRYVLVFTEKPYLKETTWAGSDPRKDLAKVDLLTGAVIPIRKGMLTQPRISPGNTFAYGYSETDSTWWAYRFSTGTFALMSKANLPSWYDEENDVPSYPSSYGSAGWVKDDQSLIFYDRYDLWAWSGESAKAPVALTKGRESNIMYRYIRTDAEEKSLHPVTPWLMYARNDMDKSSGYSWFDPTTRTHEAPTLNAYEYSRWVSKARAADAYLYTRENFSTFPNLNLSADRLKTGDLISDANPQQKEYAWGSIRLYRWMDWDSTMRTGLLVLPAGYDTLRSYPTIVNFYERSSDELHTHTAPAPHRSTINYAFYASRGYVIFNPDVTYRIGMPGESAYQVVMSGVTSLVKDRIADPENLALQGHSWGGYQIAYILTRTNMFKCAEAGAAVVNMTSAYGGIRWETGIARMFQYEHDQSRLGKSLWEDPNLYINNSALFKINKINTPLLLLHNDEDGAVPFEQGIEFYLALRRLDKTAWLLNYRGEPHWPVKWQNRKDFNIRMSQFFDHYLKGAPMPEWMEKGVPAVERGIRKGY